MNSKYVFLMMANLIIVYNYLALISGFNESHFQNLLAIELRIS